MTPWVARVSKGRSYSIMIYVWVEGGRGASFKWSWKAHAAKEMKDVSMEGGAVPPGAFKHK